MAMGSASEVEYLVLLTRELKLMKEETGDHLETRIIEIKKMLASLIKTIRAG